MNNLMNTLNNWMLHLGTWMQGATVGMGQTISTGGSQNTLNEQRLWDEQELFPTDDFGEEIDDDFARSEMDTEILARYD